MDSNARIEAYKEGLRITYAADIPGLRAIITALMAAGGGADDPVVITQMGFEGGQGTGQVTLEPLAKLQACIEVLRELDPDNVPAAPASTRFADLSFGTLET
jgi:hypothetical protein